MGIGIGVYCLLCKEQLTILCTKEQEDRSICPNCWDTIFKGGE